MAICRPFLREAFTTAAVVGGEKGQNGGGEEVPETQKDPEPPASGVGSGGEKAGQTPVIEVDSCWQARIHL